MLADLHVHSTASDGLFSPAQLFEMGREAGLAFMALTDHDTLEGLSAWPADAAGPRLIPGVEISCTLSCDIHLLAYGVSPRMTELNAFLSRMRQERAERFEIMVDKLNQQGLCIALNQIPLPPSGSVGRAHLARALFESGQVSSLQEAFNRYLAPGRPAYVPRPKRSPKEVICLLRELGAVPVIAHPGLYGFEEAAFYSLLVEWKQAGLMGLEVYHSANRPPQPYEAMARSLQLLVTGGSDFHGMDGSHSPLGSQCALWSAAHEDLHALLAALKL
ncbi:MAG: hypothetical protein IJ461_01530 [Clostridia bacterium]|nr:hypothetical protein [Clostridia bacterium]